MSWNLSVIDQEILCSLDLSGNPKALEMQCEMVSRLAEVFKNGSEEATPDQWKAAQYADQAIKLKKQLKNISGEAEEPVEQTDEKSTPSSNKARTSYYYTASGWYNFIRLYLLRVGLVSEFFGEKILPRLFGIAGFGYFVDIAFEMGVVLYTTFRSPISEEEAKLSYARRFWNVLTKDDRPSRLFNSGFWAILNCTTFILTGGLSTILTACGFGVDIVHEAVKGIRDYFRHRHTLKQVQNELQEKNTSLQKLQEKGGDVNELQKEIAALQHMETKLVERIGEVKVNRVYNFVGATVALVGLGMILFPVTVIPGVILTIVGLGLDFRDKFIGALKYLFKPSAKVEQPELVERPAVKLEAKQQPEVVPANDAKVVNSTHKECAEFFAQNPQTAPVQVAPAMAAAAPPKLPEREENIVPLFAVKKPTPRILTAETSKSELFQAEQSCRAEEAKKQEQEEYQPQGSVAVC